MNCNLIESHSKNTRKLLTLELRSVTVKLNREEGIRGLVIDADKRSVSSFIVLTEVTQLPFSTEPSNLFKYLACVTALRFTGDKNNAAFDWRKSLPSLYTLKFLKKIEYCDLSIETEEKIDYELFTTMFMLSGLQAIEKVNFLRCNFRSNQHVTLVSKYLKNHTTMCTERFCRI